MTTTKTNRKQDQKAASPAEEQKAASPAEEEVAVVVLRQFRDKHTKKTHRLGEQLWLAPERAAEIAGAANPPLIKVVEPRG